VLEFLPRARKNMPRTLSTQPLVGAANDLSRPRLGPRPAQVTVPAAMLFGAYYSGGRMRTIGEASAWTLRGLCQGCMKG